MPRNEPSEGFADRLRRLRFRMGMSKMSDFARALGLQAQSVRNWESRGSTPGLNTLTAACRRLGYAEWKDLAMWLADPECEAPSWLFKEGPIPRLGEAPPREQAPPSSAPTPSVAPSAPLWSTSASGSRRTLPWRALQTLAQQARDALDRHDIEDLVQIEREFLDLMCPHCQLKGAQGWSSESTSSQPPPATSSEPPSSSTRE